MKQTLINYIKNPKYDELYTPIEAIYPILKYLPKDKTYWECTDFGNSNITKVLKENGYNVISTGKLKDGFDFLKDKPNFNFDIIITNPPYSLKTQFLKKAYSYEKPFAFLLPLTTLEGLDRRINFLKNKKSPWFAVAWFCWKLLPKDLIFEKV